MATLLQKYTTTQIIHGDLAYLELVALVLDHWSIHHQQLYHIVH